MNLEMVEDIGVRFPKYVLRKDRALILESSNQKIIDRKEALSSPQETFLEGAEEILKEKGSIKRNVKLRAKAIEHYGLNCYICGLSFEDTYGDYGAGYIEIHHLNPLADSKSEREITIHEVRVVCSNCHSVLHHHGRVPIDVEELKAFVKARNSR